MTHPTEQAEPEFKVTRGSGNVFEDLGLADSRELELCCRIADAMKHTKKKRPNFKEAVALLKEYASTPAQPAEGWRDISTAPKDGTKIMFWDELTDYQIGFWGEYKGISEEPQTGWTDGVWPIVGDGLEGPSHWRHLPAAPSGERGGEL